MEAKLSAFLTSAIVAMFRPLLAFAQPTQPPTGPQQPPWDWPGHWHMWGGGWGFWWIFPLLMLFMIVVCITIFLLGHRSGGGPHHWGPWGQGRSWGDPTFSALQILNERFAKGEIQKDEYEEKKTAILSGGHR